MNRPPLHYDPEFLAPRAREELMRWLSLIHPIWEKRYSSHNPPPKGEEHRWLLRPVYWLGNWQFACLDYYHPPKGVSGRCVRAEPFPPVLQRLVGKMETIARRLYRGPDLPPGWKLNTCLVNLYGAKIEGNRRTDTARVGEHRDYEPGPVASLSLGERALFQFVSSRARSRDDRRSGAERSNVFFQQWLDDGSLQIFGGRLWKEQLFHRVQRVDRRGGQVFPLQVEGFETRRINFTFRYVPESHIVSYGKLPPEKRDDVREYLKQLAAHSSFFRRQLEKAGESF